MNAILFTALLIGQPAQAPPIVPPQAPPVIQVPDQAPPVYRPPTYIESIQQAAKKKVPLIVYVNQGDYGTLVKGTPEGTMYLEIDRLDGFPAQCVVVSLPDGEGWMKGWTLKHMATNEEIRAACYKEVRPAVMAQPAAFQGSSAMAGSTPRRAANC